MSSGTIAGTNAVHRVERLRAHGRIPLSLLDLVPRRTSHLAVRFRRFVQHGSGGPCGGSGARLIRSCWWIPPHTPASRPAAPEASAWLAGPTRPALKFRAFVAIETARPGRSKRRRGRRRERSLQGCGRPSRDTLSDRDAPRMYACSLCGAVDGAMAMVLRWGASAARQSPSERGARVAAASSHSVVPPPRPAAIESAMTGSADCRRPAPPRQRQDWSLPCTSTGDPRVPLS